MNPAPQIAQHLRQVYFGGNWTDVNLQQSLEGLSWQEANTSVQGLNTIAALVFHMNYYVRVIHRRLVEDQLSGSDKESFEVPEIHSQEQWETFLKLGYQEVEALALLIEGLAAETLEADFWHGKYKKYYWNLQGMIEHCHYHLGQISLIRKLLAQLAA